MPQLEDELRPCAAPIIDLDRVEHGQRMAMWDKAVRIVSPGLSVTFTGHAPANGVIERIGLGAGELFTIRSAPAEVIYHAPNCSVGADARLSLMVLSRGTIEVSQASRSCRVEKGDVCVIDEATSFRLTGAHSSEFLFLRMPRAAALSRYPQLQKLFATALPAREPGTQILADMLLRLPTETAPLGEAQRNAMMNAIIQMLGVAEPFSTLPAAANWRVRQAVDYIELNLSVAGLTAESVAQDQRISRRRLDQLMQEAVGHSIASHLWSRRLEQAAEDLRDPHRADLSVAQIAFANGFEDAAHFTRAFKRRFATTPGQWRLL